MVVDEVFGGHDFFAEGIQSSVGGGGWPGRHPAPEQLFKESLALFKGFAVVVWLDITAIAIIGVVVVVVGSPRCIC